MTKIAITVLLLALPALARAQNEDLIEAGRRLFTQETFGGNGRTCSTCHPLNANTTLSPSDIAQLPDNDPLFVAEFTPELAPRGGQFFEVPELLRGAALICENLDGFDRPCLMRSIPHTLGLRTSIEPELRADSPVVRHHTGWSGDGAPGEGALRDFATGAVTQHFTRTLARRPGIDFRLPTAEELDALEAFQLSLGRQSDVDLTRIMFLDPMVDHGRVLFMTDNAGPDGDPRMVDCQNCHNNAGANNREGRNPLNSTGVEDATGRPVQVILEAFGLDVTPGQPGLFPRDGGAGQSPSPLGGFGIDRMNAPPLIEAADTPPFFHDNSCATIECAVGFYTSSAFRGDSAARARIDLSAAEIQAIASFLRSINALENVRSAEQYLLSADPDLALADVEDAIEVLSDASLSPGAVAALEAVADILTGPGFSPLPNPRPGRPNPQQVIRALAALRTVPPMIAVSR